jgi:hypothetical protein
MGKVPLTVKGAEKYLVPKLRLGMPTFKLCLMSLIVHATPSGAWS